MTIKLRFTLTLGFLLCAFLGTVSGLEWIKSRESARAHEAYLQQQTVIFNHWIDADSNTLLREAGMIASNDTLRTSLIRRDAKPSTPDLLSAEQFLWFIHPNGDIDALVPGSIHPNSVPLLQSHPFLSTALRTEGGWFFFTFEQRLFQSGFAPVSTSLGELLGWVLLVREWDDAVMEKLGTLMGGKIRLESKLRETSVTNSHSRVVREILDWRGLRLRFLTLDISDPTGDSAWNISSSTTITFIAFGLLVISALALGLHRWVLCPLDHIRQSLLSGDTTPIRTLRDQRDEFGSVAKLVETSSAQSETLRKSEANLQTALDERVRLGRDLHDGVIQSLYATGMVLAGARSRLGEASPEVTDALDQSRSALNEAIHDLRNFITGLEPEALRHQTFGQAVGELLALAHHTRPIKTICEIDENLAARLSISQRANTLQITREAVSNALRHGEATEISIKLRPKGELAEFVIFDNGHGFDPALKDPGRGQGLENLAGRANDIGAKYSLQSQPGGGTTLKLIFSPCLHKCS